MPGPPSGGELSNIEHTARWDPGRPLDPTVHPCARTVPDRRPRSCRACRVPCVRRVRLLGREQRIPAIRLASAGGTATTARLADHSRLSLNTRTPRPSCSTLRTGSPSATASPSSSASRSESIWAPPWNRESCAAPRTPIIRSTVPAVYSLPAPATYHRPNSADASVADPPNAEPSRTLSRSSPPSVTAPRRIHSSATASRESVPTRVPRLVDRDRPGGPVHPEDQRAHVGQRGGVRRNVTGERPGRAVLDVGTEPLIEGREGLDPQLLGQCQDRSWVGPTNWPPESTIRPSPRSD